MSCVPVQANDERMATLRRKNREAFEKAAKARGLTLVTLPGRGTAPPVDDSAGAESPPKDGERLVRGWIFDAEFKDPPDFFGKDKKGILHLLLPGSDSRDEKAVSTSYCSCHFPHSFFTFWWNPETFTASPGSGVAHVEDRRQRLYALPKNASLGKTLVIRYPLHVAYPGGPGAERCESPP